MHGLIITVGNSKVDFGDHPGVTVRVECKRKFLAPWWITDVAFPPTRIADVVPLILQQIYDASDAMKARGLPHELSFSANYFELEHLPNLEAARMMAAAVLEENSRHVQVMDLGSFGTMYQAFVGDLGLELELLAGSASIAFRIWCPLHFELGLQFAKMARVMGLLPTKEGE